MLQIIAIYQISKRNVQLKGYQIGKRCHKYQFCFSNQSYFFPKLDVRKKNRFVSPSREKNEFKKTKIKTFEKQNVTFNFCLFAQHTIHMIFFLTL